jgi:hypothetical protein
MRTTTLTRMQVAAIRKLLRGVEAAEVRQGLDLANATGDLGFWESLANGLSVSPTGRVDIPAGCDVHKRVRAAHRLDVALVAL